MKLDLEQSVPHEQTIELLKDLIRIPSVNPPGNEGLVAERLAAEFLGVGLKPELHEVMPGRPNLVVRLGSGSSPHLWLNAHMDTVATGDPLNWAHKPFGAEEVGGRIYGRGATDDKGGLAALSAALIAVARRGKPLRGTVTLTAVMGEELGNVGTRRLLKDGFKADMAIVGEYSSATRIAAGYRGCLWMAINTYGRAAHGSRPHEGVNAVMEMVKGVVPLLDDLRLVYQEAPQFLVSYPTVSINTIEGGVAVNVIPERCRAEVDIRLVPGQSSSAVLNLVQEALMQGSKQRPHLRYDVEVMQATEPFWTDSSEPLVSALADSIRETLAVDAAVFGKSGTSDGNVIAAALGIPVVAYGPGNGSGHGPDEYVDAQDVLDVANVVANTIYRLCG